MKSHTHLGGQSEEILEKDEEEKTQVEECADVAGPGPKKTLTPFQTKTADIPPRRAKRSLANFMDPNLKIVCGVNNTPVKLIRKKRADDEGTAICALGLETTVELAVIPNMIGPALDRICVADPHNRHHRLRQY